MRGWIDEVIKVRCKSIRKAAPVGLRVFCDSFGGFFATVGVRGFFCDGDRRKGFL